jgi:hypothetical protein
MCTGVNYGEANEVWRTDLQYKYYPRYLCREGMAEHRTADDLMNVVMAAGQVGRRLPGIGALAPWCG